MKRICAAMAGMCAMAAGVLWAGDEPAPARQSIDPARHTASIQGTVRLAGTPPAPVALNLSGDAKCAQLHGGPLYDESLVVGKDGALRHVFVRVRKGLEGWKFAGPETPATMAQQGCLFVPRVLGLRPGQPFMVRNEDSLTHNVHGLPRRNSDFNFGQTGKGAEDLVTLLAPEDAIRVRCDIHPWMVAWVFVVDHPCFSVSGEAGDFRLTGLPAGEYVIEAWHERLGVRTQTVQVAEGQAASADFTFEAK